ncbi:HlyD family secretion protein [Rhodopseudomonas thermotolerans]|jgi:HlyD family secretion protein|uniref:HlyD family secretion protein n=2 Tax=Rhodopseudomonas TaxID=1073 RepID=A0A336JWE7_9BRAD|nr:MULTISPECIES: HlyD family efflux transporter periplasmic adaptor subunit [Rhodopseudomonas]RED37881.1 HlyD family secretion protein [Rhodopseudomonas pentothenatexigens]REG04615.1 HlyD family secretion protein [Rhodopseudomonas thermotolerans]SSW90381.1 HlyD family secretion protein [Rhodopseudomonas pentothenatexigens]
MPRVVTFLSIVVAVLAAAALLYWAFRPAAVPVDVATVSRGSFTATVEEDGKTRIRNRYVVSSPLAGRLLRLDLKPGDSVEADARVATLLPTASPMLDPRTRQELEERLGAAEASMQEAQARLDRANDQEAQARRDLERVRALHQKGAATNQQLEREELALRVAERDRVAAELRRHATEHERDQTKALMLRATATSPPAEQWDITAPVAGRVLHVMQESETVVAAGAPLIEIGDPHDLEIIADVLTTQAVEIKPGAAVMIDRWGGPGLLQGRVRFVEPAAFTKVSALGVEEQRVWVVADILSPRELWSGLGDNYRIDARFTVAEIADATVVPEGALFRRHDGWAAFVVQDGVARECAVELIRRSGRLAVVASGLQPGQQVVVFPPSTLGDGAAVTTRR